MSDVSIADIVEAPADVVWEQVLAMVEAPQSFFGDKRTVRFDTLPDGARVRNIDIAGWQRSERVTIDNEARAVVCTLDDDPLLEGSMTISVFEHGNAALTLSLVEYVGTWQARPQRDGGPAIEVLAGECRAMAVAVKRAAEASPRR